MMIDGPVIVAIHQPNFFPWLGYFHKIARCDRFIVMDNVQFPKKGGTYMNRVLIRSSEDVDWLTAPVDRGFSGVQMVSDTTFKPSQPWRRKILAAIRANYGRAPQFQDVFPRLENLIERREDNVAAYNTANLRALADAFGVDRDKLLLGSELDAKGQATDLLISMVRAAGGTGYLCGAGAAGYQEDDKFTDAGLDLVYQDFRHPIYRQQGDGPFRPGLSVIDALMNIGFDGTADLLRNPAD